MRFFQIISICLFWPASMWDSLHVPKTQFSHCSLKGAELRGRIIVIMKAPHLCLPFYILSEKKAPRHDGETLGALWAVLSINALNQARMRLPLSVRRAGGFTRPAPPSPPAPARTHLDLKEEQSSAVMKVCMTERNNLPRGWLNRWHQMSEN